MNFVSGIEATAVRRGVAESEIITRAREALIAAEGVGPWRARRIRAGRHDNKLRAIVIALRDTSRPIELVRSERDAASAAMVMNATPGLAGLSEDQRLIVAGALMQAVAKGREG
jgi:hypothetical protein